jgi:hypothetical protein
VTRLGNVRLLEANEVIGLVADAGGSGAAGVQLRVRGPGDPATHEALAVIPSQSGGHTKRGEEITVKLSGAHA